MEANISLMNELERQFAAFDGNSKDAAKLLSEREKHLPQRYIAVHGDGSARVFSLSGCLTPLQSVPLNVALELAADHRIQTTVRLRLSDHTWFLA